MRNYCNYIQKFVLNKREPEESEKTITGHKKKFMLGNVKLFLL